MTKKILVTGGCGFIGSNFLNIMVPKYKKTKFLNIDKLTYAGKSENVRNLKNLKNYNFLKLDICNYTKLQKVIKKFNPEIVIHFAAESHVDNSIKSPGKFIQSNILGTYNILRSINKKIFLVHISTDEVYGDLEDGAFFKETTPYNPSSPYSASKASSDHLVRAWGRTFGLPILITNCSNNYGPFQFPEKLIPIMIINCLNNKPLPVYGDGKNIRDWLYVTDHCSAIYKVYKNGKIQDTYNIGGNNEIKNIDIVNIICETLDELKPLKNKSYKNLITYVKDRPGHDLRYAIDSTKIKEGLGWTPMESFETGIRKTLNWYIDNEPWWRKIEKKYAQNRLGESV